MSDSSQPKDSLTTFTIESINVDDILKDCMIHSSGTGVSSDLLTITSGTGCGSITLDLNSYAAGPSISTYTATDTITLTGLGPNGTDSSYFTYNLPEEWKDSFPDWDRVKNMCGQYPGLKVAFDNFRVFYEMVKDDYDNPTPKK